MLTLSLGCACTDASGLDAAPDGAVTIDALDASADAPTLHRWTSVHAREESPSACALREDGAAVCWGWGWDGGVVIARGATFVAGNATVACWLDATQSIGCTFSSFDHAGISWAPPAGGFVMFDIYPGGPSGCAIDTAGSVTCWQTSATYYPPPMAGPFSAVSLGPAGACAISRAGAAVCWDPFAPPHTVLQPPSGTYVSISQTLGGACALSTAGEVFCWGDALDPSIRMMPPPGPFSELAAGEPNCAIDSSGAPTCWGSVHYSNQPASERYLHIASGNQFVCAIRLLDRGISCWGDDTHGTLVPPS